MEPGGSACRRLQVSIIVVQCGLTWKPSMGSLGPEAEARYNQKLAASTWKSSYESMQITRATIEYFKGSVETGEPYDPSDLKPKEKKGILRGAANEISKQRLAMGWLRAFFRPLRKLWMRYQNSVHKEGAGIYILYEDVKSCPYEDVQVLWSILVESQPQQQSMPSRVATMRR